MKRLALLLCAACGDNLEGEDRQGGATTIDDRSREAYRHPAANLDEPGRARFQAGRSPFDFHWEVPKLGPLFNNDACLGCHGGNGRGLSQIGFGTVSQALVRVSDPTGTPDVPNGPAPVLTYGTQLQDHATVGLPEANITLTWVDVLDSYGDGEMITLREPRLVIKTPLGEFLPGTTAISYRQAPPLIGLGLLEAIELVPDPDDADGDGISGRVNQVWDPTSGAAVAGRFGWKANTSTLLLQVSGAFDNDMGLSSKVFPEVDRESDVNDQQLDDSVFFTSTIAVPIAGARDGTALRGRALFATFGCEGCHVPTHVTGDHPIAALAHQRIHPYTDLLLHDMGDRLADARPDFLATGTEWRTPPLWGIGLAQIVQAGVTFLHDGRARTLAEAILWHGGEAQSAREAFRTAPRSDRDALISFLDTL